VHQIKPVLLKKQPFVVNVFCCLSRIGIFFYTNLIINKVEKTKNTPSKKQSFKDIKGFLAHPRATPDSRATAERIGDYKEIYVDFPLEKSQQQAARCMDCGVPFCHNGCPLGNIIPEFNEAVADGNWLEAYTILSETNNFPEFTGRICPAPCESSCVLGINQPAVAIEHIEKTIAEIAFEQNFVRPAPPQYRTGRTVAIVGSGPAGLAAADQLNRLGHAVTIFEKADRVGGLLMYGIPDFKLEKWVIERRVELMKKEGIQFRLNANIGGSDLEGDAMTTQQILKDFDAIVVAIGSTVPRDLPLEGRELKGVHYAMDYLTQSNRRVAGDKIVEKESIFAENKHVVVIGGGDTGSDCIGTANRQAAKSITQLDYHLKPPNDRSPDTPWPLYPKVFRNSSSHEEGCDRQFSVQTKRFVGENGVLTGVEIVELEWEWNDIEQRNTFAEVKNSLRIIPADYVFLAIGFSKPNPHGLITQLGLKADARGNIETKNYATTHARVYACGDAKMGQSLVVNAIAEGRNCAEMVHKTLISQ
jgi:glutamate synthase (NADPH/NADH) small chain